VSRQADIGAGGLGEEVGDGLPHEHAVIILAGREAVVLLVLEAFHYPHLFTVQPGLFLQLAERGLQQGLPFIHTPLRELPERALGQLRQQQQKAAAVGASLEDDDSGGDVAAIAHQTCP
jgi:hypothetical protein